jgi:hypothetical protein
MKKLFLFATLLVSTSAFAQETEQHFKGTNELKLDGCDGDSLPVAQLTMEVEKPPKDEPVQLKLWSVYRLNTKVTIDMSAGFIPSTMEVGIGYDVSKMPCMFVVPKLTLLVGDYIAAAPGFRFMRECEHFGINSNTEYIFSFNSRKPQIFYDFLELSYSPYHFIEIGVVSELKLRFLGSDIYIKGVETEYEFGPMLKFNFRQFFALWKWTVRAQELKSEARIMDASIFGVGIGYKLKCKK